MLFLLLFPSLIFLFLFFSHRPFNLSFGKILAIAAFLRIGLAVGVPYPRSDDTYCFLLVGQLTIKGQSLYPHLASLCQPFFPLYLYLIALATYFGKILPPLVLIKLLLSGFDLAILFLIYVLTKKDRQKALLYAICPLPLLALSLHGQFDALPLFFLLLAIYLFDKKKEFLSVLGLSLGITTKTWTFYS